MTENQGFEINQWILWIFKGQNIIFVVVGFSSILRPPAQFHALDVGQSLGTCPV